MGSMPTAYLQHGNGIATDLHLMALDQQRVCRLTRLISMNIFRIGGRFCSDEKKRMPHVKACIISSS